MAVSRSRRSLKRRYKKARAEFREELREILKNDRALGMAIFLTYVSEKRRIHITKVWYILGTRHKEAYKDYCKELMGSNLCVSDDIFKTLHFSGYQELSKKYIRLMPECFAMGEAFGLAKKCVNGKL